MTEKQPEAVLHLETPPDGWGNIALCFAMTQSWEAGRSAPKAFTTSPWMTPGGSSPPTARRKVDVNHIPGEVKTE